MSKKIIASNESHGTVLCVLLTLLLKPLKYIFGREELEVSVIYIT